MSQGSVRICRKPEPSFSFHCDCCFGNGHRQCCGAACRGVASQGDGCCKAGTQPKRSSEDVNSITPPGETRYLRERCNCKERSCHCRHSWYCWIVELLRCEGYIGNINYLITKLGVAHSTYQTS